MMGDGPQISDPSRLTTEQLRRELASLQKLIEVRLAYHDDKFAGVQTVFRERDLRAAHAERSAMTAFNAALQAQKEAVAAQNASNSAAITKSEAATADQIKGISLQLAGFTKAADDRIAEINHRLDRGEGIGSGRASHQASMLAISAVVVSVIGCGYGIYRAESASARAPMASIGIDSKRVDDLVSRMDSMSVRMNSMSPILPK
jgi:hypothetical protein